MAVYSSLGSFDLNSNVLSYYVAGTSTTASSTTETIVATMTIPQSAIGTNGRVLIDIGAGCVGDANTSTIKLKKGGSEVQSWTLGGTQVDDNPGSGLPYVETSVDSSAGDVVYTVTVKNSISAGTYKTKFFGCKMLAIK